MFDPLILLGFIPCFHSLVVCPFSRLFLYDSLYFLSSVSFPPLFQWTWGTALVTALNWIPSSTPPLIPGGPFTTFSSGSLSSVLQFSSRQIVSVPHLILRSIWTIPFLPSPSCYSRISPTPTLLPNLNGYSPFALLDHHNFLIIPIIVVVGLLSQFVLSFFESIFLTFFLLSSSHPLSKKNGRWQSIWQSHRVRGPYW